MNDLLTRPLKAAHDLRARSVASVDHADVLSYLTAEGGNTLRYDVLVVLSCGIAILGLLLSSPAVIIGAMLISPLMNPIILFGFSLAIRDYRLARRSFVAVALGALLAVGFAALIVWLSPLYGVTAEILSRTRPNLFDLLVAVFSAMAGGFAIMQRRAETIAGVAIATALMPPLAVTGYGLAVGNWTIFEGAGGLFMTNLLAITLTVSLVARFFGFGAHNSPKHTYWQTMGIVAALVILSIPLGLSLDEIASEALTTSRARSALESLVHQHHGDLYEFKATFPPGKPVRIEAMVLTRDKGQGIEASARAALQKLLGRPVMLTLSLVQVGTHESLDAQAVAQLIETSQAHLVAQEAQSRKPPPVDMAARIAAEGGFSVLDVSADDAHKQALVRADAVRSSDLAALRTVAAHLATLYPGWQIDVRPRLASEYRIDFAPNDAQLAAAAQAQIADIAWALHVNGVQTVEVVGHADSAGGRRAANRAIAKARAQTVLAALAGSGLAASARGDYPAPGQQKTERELGQAAFRTAIIRPVLP